MREWEAWVSSAQDWASPPPPGHSANRRGTGEVSQKKSREATGAAGMHNSIPPSSSQRPLGVGTWLYTQGWEPRGPLEKRGGLGWLRNNGSAPPTRCATLTRHGRARRVSRRAVHVHPPMCGPARAQGVQPLGTPGRVDPARPQWESPSLGPRLQNVCGMFGRFFRVISSF